MAFSEQQRAAMDAELDPARIHTRRKQGIELRYVEGYDCIRQANAIFGYHAWSYQVTKLELAAGVWVATVLLTVSTPEGESVGREDVGVGIPAVARDSNGVPSPDAHETAIKGAVTDALKRALRTFGDAWGNGLYDKDAPQPGAGAATQGNGHDRESGHTGEDVMEVQRAVLSRLKAAMQKMRFDPAAFEDLRAGWLKQAGLEHWGKLTADQWRAYERAITAQLGGEVAPAPGSWEATASPAPAAPGKCPTCGGPMHHKAGTSKAGKPFDGYFCDDRNCEQKPIWANTGGGR